MKKFFSKFFLYLPDVDDLDLPLPIMRATRHVGQKPESGIVSFKVYGFFFYNFFYISQLWRI